MLPVNAPYLHFSLSSESKNKPKWAYGEAGNGNEMETGNGNWKWNWKQKWKHNLLDVVVLIKICILLGFAPRNPRALLVSSF